MKRLLLYCCESKVETHLRGYKFRNLFIIYSLRNLFIQSVIFIPAFPLWRSRGSSPRRSQNTSRSRAISDRFWKCPPRWGQARSGMQSLHLVLEQPLGGFTVDRAVWKAVGSPQKNPDGAFRASCKL